MRQVMVWAALAGWLAAAAAQDGVVELRGRGVDGKPAYRGGKIEFLSADLLDQLVHFRPGQPLPLRLRLRYRVHEPAPVLLTSRFGTEYWKLYRYPDGPLVALNTVENIDLSKPGEAAITTTQMTVATKYGGEAAKGLVGMRGHYYFLVEQPGGPWLDTINAPAWFGSRELAAKLVCTLADLSAFRLELPQLRSTWAPGGPLQFRVEVVDAAGERLPVARADATVAAGAWRATAQPVLDPLGVPSGWYEVRLPEAVPAAVDLTVKVACLTPDGPRDQSVTARFPRGSGQASLADLRREPEAPPVVRNAAGVVRETRALWVGRDAILTRAGTDDLVRRAKAAGLNVLVPNLTGRSTLAARSEVLPLDPAIETGFDPLAYLLERAHAAGLEVHPWFTCTYRDAKGRQALGGGVDIIDREGQVVALGACNHRPAYRDAITRLMIGVARDYPVDGIHLDYIRVMSDCWCDACRREFQVRHGKPLTAATADEWRDWNRAAIGDVVRRVAEGVRQARPRAILSAAVFAGRRSGAAQGQDPDAWARQGWLDVVMPMDYDADTLAVRATEREFLAGLDQDDQLVTGLSMYVRDGERAIGRDPELVAQQIRMVRQLGIHGYCLFVSTFLDDGRLEMLQQANEEPAVPFFR